MNPAQSHTRLLLCCALPAEAAPLAKAWGMKRRPLPGTWEGWSDAEENCFLLASGLGKVQQAAAVAAALAQRAAIDGSRPLRAINLGLSATRDKNIPLGRVYQIAKVTDTATQRSFFPDLLVDLELPLAEVCTVDRPVSPIEDSETASPPTLYDMEASGFWQAAQRFLPSDSIYSMKVVSDYGFASSQEIPYSVLLEKWDAALPTLIAAVEKIRDFPEPEKLELPNNLQQWKERLIQHLRLTATQATELERMLLQRESRSLDSVPHLKKYLTGVSPEHTHERKRQFQNILHELLER